MSEDPKNREWQSSGEREKREEKDTQWEDRGAREGRYPTRGLHVLAVVDVEIKALEWRGSEDRQQGCRVLL